MIDYTPGTILYVKTTEEPVTVIASRPMNETDAKHFPPSYEGSKVLIVVRRPIFSDSAGIRYAFFDFLSEELESGEEKARRLYESIKARQGMVMEDPEFQSNLGNLVAAKKEHKN